MQKSKDIINKKIKERYKTKALFSEELGIRPKDFASKIRTVKTKIDWLNKFLGKLDLKIKIVDKYEK